MRSNRLSTLGAPLVKSLDIGGISRACTGRPIAIQRGARSDITKWGEWARARVERDNRNYYQNIPTLAIFRRYIRLGILEGYPPGRAMHS